MSLQSIVDIILERVNSPNASIDKLIFEQEEVTRPPEKIRALIQYLIPRDALFATFLLKARYIKNHPDVDTVGVNITNGRINFFYNEDFINKFPPNQLMFIIAHEFYHIARLHLDRAARRKMNPHLYNIAADQIINESILKDLGSVAGLHLEMPKINGQEIGWRIDKNYAKARPDSKLWTTETLYKFLEKNKPAQQQKPPKKKDLMKPGTVVRIGDGEDFGIITKANKDGTYDVERISKEEVMKRLGAL